MSITFCPLCATWDGPETEVPTCTVCSFYDSANTQCLLLTIISLLEGLQPS